MSLIQLQVKEEKREELINDSEMPSGEPATLSQHTITEEMPPPKGHHLQVLFLLLT